ncbi:MAG: helix-turn-helix transcriptional regulator [Phycisphaerales bacterium]|nr:helix-turn-helix transcriptional regulator [Phycisphaerales bacterium]
MDVPPEPMNVNANRRPGEDLISSRANVEQDGADETSRMGRFGRMVLRLGSERCDDLEQWLRVVSDAVRLWIVQESLSQTKQSNHSAPNAGEQGGIVAGVWAGIFEAGILDGWRCVSASVSGYRNASGREALMEHLLAGCGRDDLPGGVGPLGGLPMDGCVGSVKLRSLYPDTGKRYGVLRRELGLGEFGRLIRLVPGTRSPWALVVQVDGTPGEHWNEAEVLSGLLTFGSVLPAAFQRSIGRTVTRRERLLSQLTEAQRAMVPLLVAGMTERDVGQRLGRSYHTVHDYVKTIYGLLNVSSRLDLARLWHGLDEENSPEEDDLM